jgi:hypothetical protein
LRMLDEVCSLIFLLLGQHALSHTHTQTLYLSASL